MKMQPCLVLAALALLFSSVSITPACAADNQTIMPGSIVLATMDGVINPITEDYFNRVVGEAEDAKAGLVLVEMDTPGGLMESMREIVKRMAASRVPVCVYVAPQGSRAASAGMYITMAAHVAAMAPNTVIGAAHPVGIGGAGTDDKVMLEKITNDTVAWIREIARNHGRNADWAEKGVRDSVSIGTEQAVKDKVVDLSASSRDELLTAIDGRVVEVAGAKGERIKVTLATKNKPIIEIPMTLKEEVLHTVGQPDIAVMLLTLGGLALVFEVTQPGMVLPGVVGVIAVCMAFLGLKILPISYVGLLLIIASLIFFVLDLKFNTSGALVIGGAVAMAMGCYLLIDVPELRVSKVTITSLTATVTGMFAFVLSRAVAGLRAPIITGTESLLGKIATAKEDFDSSGFVMCEGELWKAHNAGTGMIKSGDHVRIAGITELTLRVVKDEPPRA